MNRQDLIQNAVAFLNDPKTQASPLPQRIQFLEAKGLTPQEVELALKQATIYSVNNGTYATSHDVVSHGTPSRLAPWDWRDYFITGIVSGTIVYGAVSLFRPMRRTGNALTAQFDAAEALLKEIQAESAAVRNAVEKQNSQIEQTTKEVEAVVKEMRDGEIKTRDELREVREEVNTIRDMLPKMIERNKDHQSQSLAELQQELKSLKALLLSRTPTATTSLSALPAPGRPSIPAWQLGSAGQSPGTALNGTGKEVEGSSLAT